MKLAVAAATALVVLASAMTTHAQDRLPPIPADRMTDSQREAAGAFAANRGQEVFGPFAALLRSPEVMLRAMAMGDYLRFRTVLPRPLNELVILLTARRWTQQYEWSVHYGAALDAGLSQDVIRAVSEGRRPDRMSADEATVHDFATELLNDQRVSDRTYASAVARFGEQGVVDITSVAGYYTFLSFVMNMARTAVPAGTTAPRLRE
jgi:4-carboxymuconolactone decarboxylase